MNTLAMQSGQDVTDCRARAELAEAMIVRLADVLRDMQEAGIGAIAMPSSRRAMRGKRMRTEAKKAQSGPLLGSVWACRECGKEFPVMRGRNSRADAMCKPCRAKTYDQSGKGKKLTPCRAKREEAADWMPYLEDPIDYYSAARAWGIGMGYESKRRINLLVHMGLLVSVAPGRFAKAE